MINYFKKVYYEKYSKKSYSLSNVDLVIERIFKNKKNGVFVDVGCNHPIKYNNTYLLYNLYIVTMCIALVYNYYVTHI